MHCKNILLHTIVFMSLLLSSPLFASTELNAYDIYGKPHHFSAHPGKWIIINYWASWCYYCTREIPELNKVAEAIQTLPAIFFAINYDALSDQEQQQFAENHQMNFLLLHNNPFDRYIDHSMITTLPTTFIISPTGQVRQLDGEQHLDTIIDAIRDRTA